MLPRTLGVIGLGAIGGSVAHRAAKRGTTRIVGHDASTKEGVAAVKAGAVTELVHDPIAVVTQADLVVLAEAPKATVATLARVAQLLIERHVYATDVTVVKRPVLELAAALGLQQVFAGSHPFVDLSGTRFVGSAPDRLEGAVVYVTPLPDGGDAAAEIVDFWKRAVGAQPVSVQADRHDASLAWTSHLPKALSSALATAFARGGPSGATYGATALDATAAAGERPEIWVDVLLANRDNVLVALEGLTASIDGLRDALTRGDRGAVESWLAEAAAWRRRYEG
jgi:prephenate dehydrogenase